MAATPPAPAHPGFTNAGPADSNDKAAPKKANKKAQPPVEVVYPDQPPQLEQVAILGPFRTVLANKDRDRTEREAVENDFNWFRYSRLAAPCLLFLVFLLTILLGLTFWQMSGGLKDFQQDVPRYHMLNEFWDDDGEGGAPTWVRDLRITYTVLSFVTVVLLFWGYWARPALSLQRLINLIGIFLLFVVLVLSLVAFSSAVNDNSRATQCPVTHYGIPDLQVGLSTNKGAVYTASQSADFSNFGRYNTPQNLHTTFEPCKSEYKLSATANIIDGFIAFLCVWAILALVFVVIEKRGFWRRREGWRAQQEAEKDFFKGSKVRPGPLADQSVHVVRTQLVTVLLLIVLAFTIAQALIVIVLHYNKTTYAWSGVNGHDGLSDGNHGPGGKTTLYRPGWPVWNSRLRIAAAATGIFLILITLLPHRSKIMATLLAWGLFGVWFISLASFIADIAELEYTSDLPCPVNTHCDYAPFIGTIIVTGVFLLASLVYLLIEHATRMSSIHSNRTYTILELKEHETRLCSRRPVKCGVTMVHMKAIEYRGYRATLNANQAPEVPQIVPNETSAPRAAAVAAAPVEEWQAPREAVAPPAAYPSLAQVPYDQGYRPFLGIMVQDNQAPDGSVFVSVTEVNSNGPAARAGLSAGDTIAQWQRPGSPNMEGVLSVNDWNQNIHSCRPGDHIHVEVVRNQPDGTTGTQVFTIQIGGIPSE